MDNLGEELGDLHTATYSLVSGELNPPQFSSHKCNTTQATTSLVMTFSIVSIPLGCSATQVSSTSFLVPFRSHPSTSRMSMICVDVFVTS